jgi:glycosyltransferase involved in cell wall biosynthesis
MPLLSFILPIYNETENLPSLWAELQKVQTDLGPSYACEFIFVNDGSQDDSLAKLQALYQANSETVKVINFSRNYGHQIAVTAGQDAAAGEAVVIMDADLQDPPAVILDLVKKWEEGFDVVYAQRRSYKTNPLKKWPAFLFYRLMSKIANIEIPVDTGDFRLLSKRVNEEMKKYREHARFLRGISSLVGFKQTAVLFDRQSRFAGKPGYTFGKSLRLAVDGITSFSLFPIRVVSLTGIFFAIASFVCGLGYILGTLILGHSVEGWASLMFTMIFFGGIQLIMLGILGEYIGRIYTEVLHRPLYTVAQKWGFGEENK